MVRRTVPVSFPRIQGAVAQKKTDAMLFRISFPETLERAEDLGITPLFTETGGWASLRMKR